MGAGVIPLTVKDGQVQFLFQQTFSGRKVGHLIDFGGGLGDNEDYRATAVREFIEETETMYFSNDLQSACRTDESVMSQFSNVETLFENTLSPHPHWWCRRKQGNSPKPRDWITYFIQFPYRDISLLNSEWKLDTTSRFRKRRELSWVSADRLLQIYANSPQDLWKRVRQLEHAETLIQEIKSTLTNS